MYRPVPTLSYSPRTLVAIMSTGDGSGPGGAGGSGGSAGGPGSGAGGPSGNAGGPSPDTAWRNLMQPMPLGRKIRLTVRNTSIKIKTHQQCCGHPGEPGC